MKWVLIADCAINLLELALSASFMYIKNYKNEVYKDEEKKVEQGR